MSSKALIIVDVQNDFLKDGALAVPEGEAVINPILQLAKYFDFIIASRDFHPANHCSFTINGGIWPVHCVSGTYGAKINSEIDSMSHIIISKGYLASKDAYSAFDGTMLDDILKMRGVKEVYIVGLATDYCIKETAKDAKKLGYTTFVVRDCVKAVNVNVGDGDLALNEMQQMGIEIKSLDFVIKEVSELSNPFRTIN